jgi:hypothetical protein
MSAVDGWEGTGEVTSTTVTCIRGDGHSWSDADRVAIQVAVNITQSEEARADRLSGACRRSKPPPTSYDVPEVALISHCTFPNVLSPSLVKTVNAMDCTNSRRVKMCEKRGGNAKAHRQAHA